MVGYWVDVGVKVKSEVRSWVGVRRAIFEASGDVRTGGASAVDVA